MHSIILLAALKYIFLFIGDGMSVPQRMIAEEFSLKTGGEKLAMNLFPYQVSTRTKSADSIVTDSAASATAMACGEKTDNGVLGLAPDGRRLESVAEIAKKRGMKVGMITSVTIVHATPGGFYAHRKSRGQYYQIALDLVSSGFDYFAGGGVSGKHDDRADPLYRGNVFDLARKAGYTVVFNRDDWAALKPGGRSWSVFGDGVMPYDIDDTGEYPKLHELLEKGIELLDNPKGFFIMCEGGKIDHAGHANDAASNLRDVLALDRAVKAALEFQKAHPDETLIITTGDHETGGMSMGFAGAGTLFNVEKLAAQKKSLGAFSVEIQDLMSKSGGELKFEEVKPMLKEYLGLETLSSAEEKLLSDAFAKDIENIKAKLKDSPDYDAKRRYVFAQTAVNTLQSRAGVSWSTYSHTALPTLTTAKGPGAEILIGMTDNTEISIRLKSLIEKGR